MTPQEFDESLRRLQAAAFDEGVTAGLSWAASVIAGERLQETVNPYRKEPNAADN